MPRATHNSVVMQQAHAQKESSNTKRAMAASAKVVCSTITVVQARCLLCDPLVQGDVLIADARELLVGTG
jgi:hypothetical protein